MRRRIAAAVLAATLTLAGCAGQDPYPAAVADRLQDAVFQVTTAAASGNLDAALASLLELEARVEAAHTAGQLSGSRYDEVRAAIARTRAKIEEQKATGGGATPAPAPSEGSEGGESGGGTGGGPDEDEEPEPEDPAPDEEAPPATTAPTPGASRPATPPVTPAPTPSATPTATPEPTPSATASTTTQQAARTGEESEAVVSSGD